MSLNTFVLRELGNQVVVNTPRHVLAVGTPIGNENDGHGLSPVNITESIKNRFHAMLGGCRGHSKHNRRRTKDEKWGVENGPFSVGFFMMGLV